MTHCSWAKSGLPSVSVVSMGCCHTHLFTCCLQQLSHFSPGWVVVTQTVMAQSWKYFLSDPLQKMVSNLWFMVCRNDQYKSHKQVSSNQYNYVKRGPATWWPLAMPTLSPHYTFCLLLRAGKTDARLHLQFPTSTEGFGYAGNNDNV